MPDLPRAVVLLDRAIAIDSTAGSSAEKGGPCRLCDAFSMLTTRYEWADSVDAVQRTLRRWRSMRPNDTQPWVLLFDWLVSLGRRAEAEEALRQYDALGGHFANVHFTNLVTSLRLDDLEAGDRACADALATTDGAARGQFRWYCVIALRMEGRYRDALALARDGRVPWPGASRKPMTPDPHEVASVELEGGAPLAAADEFYRLYAASDSARMQPGVRARQGTWLLTLTATAAVAGGDTARARGLVDTIDSLGRRSLFGRDQRLHHFVRGLLHARAHEDEAAVREYRAAMHSPTYGYTRINLELGRALLALRRPDEGIPVVQAALHGGIEGSNLYVTRTELHELLARLFDAAGRRDSAAAHYRVVERAWRSADPFLRSRYEAARGWLARAAK
jgi:hypothetical protein